MGRTPSPLVSSTPVGQPLGPNAPRQLGRYELLEKLGAGGMGEIYLGRAAGTGGRRVALKTLPPGADTIERFVGMFFDEARIAMHLKHPNIARVYEFGEDEGIYYLAMEWIPGKNLYEIRRAARTFGPVPLPIVARIGADVAGALAYAHAATDHEGASLQIVHRDVSATNVMVHLDGPVKLLDFGLAKARTQAEKTRPGYVKGKFGYLAPEQLLKGRVDARTDVFQLGICLWELLAGRPLFREKSTAAVVTAVRSFNGPPPLASVRNDLPAAVDATLARAMAVDPEARYETAAAFRDAIVEAMPRVAEDDEVARYMTQLFPASRYVPSVVPGPRGDDTGRTDPASLDAELARIRAHRRRRTAWGLATMVAIVGLLLFVVALVLR